MGSKQGQENEQPVHRVWVDDFYLATCQVTNFEYGLFLGGTGNTAPPFWNDPNFNHPEQPVVAVSWFEAMRYCEWLSSLTGRNYRLPTEAEWERACRGDVDGKLYPWGDAPPQSRPDYDKLWITGPEPVRRSQPNQFGLYEMCENVHEWCSDWFAADYYANSSTRNPRARNWNSSLVPWGLLASSRENIAMLRPFQHSAGIPIRRLWIPASVRCCCISIWRGHFVRTLHFVLQCSFADGP